MSIASKLFGFWMFRRTVSSTTPLFMRLLMGMAALTITAVAVAILGAFIVFGALWLIYGQLVAHGIEPTNAQLIIAGIVLAMFAYTLSLAQKRWETMRKTANAIVYLQSPVSGKLSSLVDAFMDGYDHPHFSARRR